ncbi:MAG: helix-turn-helix transcriptional regulator [Vicinamibacterales bacterium]
MNKLRVIRKARDLTQDELAYFTGYSQTLISLIECDAYPSRVSDVARERFARVLRVHVRDIWPEDE